MSTVQWKRTIWAMPSTNTSLTALWQLVWYIRISSFCTFILTLPEGCMWLLWNKSDVPVLEQHGMANDVSSFTFSLIFNEGCKVNNMLFFPLILYIPSLSKVNINSIQLRLYFITISGTGDEITIWHLKQWLAHLRL